MEIKETRILFIEDILSDIMKELSKLERGIKYEHLLIIYDELFDLYMEENYGEEFEYINDLFNLEITSLTENI